MGSDGEDGVHTAGAPRQASLHDLAAAAAAAAVGRAQPGSWDNAVTKAANEMQLAAAMAAAAAGSEKQRPGRPAVTEAATGGTQARELQLMRPQLILQGAVSLCHSTDSQLSAVLVGMVARALLPTVQCNA